MQKRIKNWLINQIRKIDSRVEDIDYAIKMYGWDAWGSSAFSNMEKMEKLEKERVKILKKKYVFQAFKELI